MVYFTKPLEDIKGGDRNGSADDAGDDTVSASTLAMVNDFLCRVARQNGGKTGSLSLDNDKITPEVKEKQRLRGFKKMQTPESDLDSLEKSFIVPC